jgi:isopentenyl phosphate kinase
MNYNYYLSNDEKNVTEQLNTDICGGFTFSIKMIKSISKSSDTFYFKNPSDDNRIKRIMNWLKENYPELLI